MAHRVFDFVLFFVFVYFSPGSLIFYARATPSPFAAYPRDEAFVTIYTLKIGRTVKTDATHISSESRFKPPESSFRLTTSLFFQK